MTEDFTPTRILLTFLFLFGGLWIAGSLITTVIASESLGLTLTAWEALRGIVTGMSVMALAKIGIALTYISDNSAVLATKAREDAKAGK